MNLSTPYCRKTRFRNQAHFSVYYRPQRSRGKVKFSQASVILFTGRGGVIFPGQTYPRQTHLLADTLPLGRHSPPWVDTPLGRQPLPLGRHPGRQTPPHPPGDGHCSGRYASYWMECILVFNCEHRSSLHRTIMQPLHLVPLTTSSVTTSTRLKRGDFLSSRSSTAMLKISFTMNTCLQRAVSL